MRTDIAGLACEPFEMIVEVGKVREFASATKSRNPEYLEGWSPSSPPTFLASAAFWMKPENSPLQQADLVFERTLNGSQEFLFHGPPPRAGTRLTGTARVDKVYDKKGRRGGIMRFMEYVIDYVDDFGTPVAEVRSTIIETSLPVSAR